MFSRFFGPKPPTSQAGRLCFDLINQTRSVRGHSARTPLSTALGENSEFIGVLLGVMDLISTKTDESHLLRPNTIELFECLWGLEPGSGQYSNGLNSALQLMNSGGENEALLDSIMRTQEAMLSGEESMERELYAIVSKYF